MKLEKKTILAASLTFLFGLAVAFASFQAGDAASVPEGTEGSLEFFTDISVEEVKATEESGEVTIDFDTLQAKNPDIYAWITVPGTDIDYPVLQKTDSEDPYNNYYLDHTVDHTEGLPGAIYSQGVNRKDFKDSVTVLYGHNMKHGGMFTSLHEFEDKAFFEENSQVLIYTPAGTFTYEIFAAAEFSDALIPYEYDFSSPSEVQRYLDDVGGCKGNFRETAKVSKEDNILTLSTCYSGREENRLLVEAVLVEEGQAK